MVNFQSGDFERQLEKTTTCNIYYLILDVEHKYKRKQKIKKQKNVYTVYKKMCTLIIKN